MFKEFNYIIHGFSTFSILDIITPLNKMFPQFIQVTKFVYCYDTLPKLFLHKRDMCLNEVMYTLRVKV